MRVYRKTTQHPICVYLTLDEAAELITECQIAEDHSSDVPELATLGQRLDVLLSDPKRERA